MKLFFDTSALIKFFHEEDGTQEVTRLITSEENEISLISGSDWLFVASDKTLCDIAQSMGFKTINPQLNRSR